MTRDSASVSLSTLTIVDAAARVADAEGVDAVSLSRVARELGSSQPALYRHVDGYDGLMRHLGLRGREILAQRLAEAGIGVAGEDAVQSMGKAWRHFVAEHPGLYAATDRSPCAGDDELEAAVRRIVEILSIALIAFDFDDEQRGVAARLLRSTFHGFAHLEAGDGHPSDQDLDDSFDEILRLLSSVIRTYS